MTTQRLLESHHYHTSSRHRAAFDAMSKFYILCSMFLTITVMTAIQTAKSENNVDDKCSSCHYNRIAKRSAIKDSGFFFIPNFWSSSDVSKPDFITTFDLFRLLNQDYAMKQFYCVINQDPCDSVGLRLKASIPEAINTDCERCTSTEFNNIRRVMNYVKNNYPEFWHRVEPIYKKEQLL